MAGPIKKTLREKERDGDYIPAIPDPPKVLRVQCPSWMPKYGKKMFTELSKKLISEGVLTEWDIQTFELLCSTYHYVREAQDIVQTEGLLVTGATGGLIANPAVSIYGKYAAAYKQLAEMFGLSPMSRKRIDLNISNPSKGVSKFARLGRKV